MDSEVQDSILAAIKVIRGKKQRPSKNEIFYHIGDVSDEIFHENFNVLIDDGRIYNKNGKDSYYINENFLRDIQNDISITDREIDDNNLITMLKDLMLNDRINEKKNMEDLKK